MSEPTKVTVAAIVDDCGYSQETCLRCGWKMGWPPLNCQNDDTPHRFPSSEVARERFHGLRWRWRYYIVWRLIHRKGPL